MSEPYINRILPFITEQVLIDEHGEWECLCGNVSSASGFAPCDERGVEVEPLPKWCGWYVCNKCCRVIASNGRVVGMVDAS